MAGDAHHYDRYSHTGPKIFVGEWAFREGSPTPNMHAPLPVNVNPGDRIVPFTLTDGSPSFVSVTHAGTAATLPATSATATNALTNPVKIITMTTFFPDAGTTFDRTFAPYFITELHPQTKSPF